MFCLCVCSQEAVYITGDLWEEMLSKEKDKVRALEEEYADKLRRAKVRQVTDVATINYQRTEHVKLKLKLYPVYQTAPFQTLSLPLFPFVRGEVLPATSSPHHLIVFSTLLCLFKSCLLLPVFLLSCHPHISLNTVLPSQPWPHSSPPALPT